MVCFSPMNFGVYIGGISKVNVSPSSEQTEG